MLYGIRTTAADPPFHAKLPAIAAAGLSAAELSFNYEPADLNWRDGRRARDIRNQAAGLGLTLTGHAPDCYWLTDPDSDRRRTTIAELTDCLPGMAAFGATTAVVHACPSRPALAGRGPEQEAALRDSLAALAPVCEAAGIRLLVEIMTPGRISSRLDTLLSAVAATGSPGIGLCLDVNHLNLSEPLGPAIRRAGAWTGEFHLSDNHGQGEEHLMLGAGIIDWDTVAAAIAATGFDGPLILETNTFDAQRFPNRLSAAGDAARRLAGRIEAARVPRSAGAETA